MIDFKAISSALLRSAGDILSEWFPAGVQDGREFRVGNLAGDKGDSLSINMESGLWSDFATGESGGDLVSLYAAITHQSQKDAAIYLANRYKIRIDDRTDPDGMPQDMDMYPQPKDSRTERSVNYVPTDAPPPPFDAHKYKPAIATWEYRSPDNRLIGYVARYLKPDGEKTFAPWTWDSGKKKWRALGFARPTPVYNGHKLSMYPERPILVVEGEKAAEAAQMIVGDQFIVVTWPGGVNGYRHAQWECITGRSILLWPDADSTHTYNTKDRKGELLPYHEQPGPKAMFNIAKSLRRAGNKDISIIDVSDVDHDGWDAADALEEGITWTSFYDWYSPRMRAFGTVVDMEANISESTGESEGNSEHSVYTWSRLGLQPDGAPPHANMDNVVRILENHPYCRGKIWFDEFSHRTMTTLRTDIQHEWSDADTLALLLFIQRKIAMPRVSRQTVDDAVSLLSKFSVRNEPKEWIESLTWDGKGRIDSIMTRGFGAPVNQYTTSIGKCWMISIVARIFDPGCQVDTMPVFEGSQGVRKSSGLRVLGGKWFTECHEKVTSKDFYMVLQGRFLVEIAEMHAFSNGDIDLIKGLITNRTDRFRLPYDRHAMDHPRACVFAGTTNRYDWNRDRTGARRFWPIRCERVDTDWIEENRDQLFAEARDKYQKGVKWWDYPEELARIETDKRRPGDPWLHLLSEYMRTQTSVGATTVELLTNAIQVPRDRQDTRSYDRVNACMEQMGYQKESRDSGGHEKIFWIKD